MKNILKSTGLIGGAIVALTLAGSAASAATFDFVAMIDDPANPDYVGAVEANWADAFSTTGGLLTIDGIGLTASGTNTNGNDADAFFDRGTAGLGVCSSWSCATGVKGAITSDDNVTAGETLTLAFDQFVNITSISFRESHTKLLNGTINLLGYGALTIIDGAVVETDALLGKSIFSFEHATGNDFYMANATAVSAVPLPAGAVLLLTGLAGMGVVGRRRKQATA